MDSIASMESQLAQARNMRNGEWIERCCFQERRKLCNRGAKEAKNATYQFKTIQRFKSVADYNSWMTGVIQAIKSRAGGDELVHLMHVTAYRELKTPFPPEFNTLIQDKFDQFLATTQEIELRLQFETEFVQWQQSGQAPATSPVTPAHTAASEEYFLKNEAVEVLLGKEDDGNDDQDWVPGQVMEPAGDKSGPLVYVEKDKDGAKACRLVRISPPRIRRSSYQGAPVLLTPSPKQVTPNIISVHDAYLHGYSDDFPIGVVLWRLGDASKEAQALDSALFSEVEATIAEEGIRAAIANGSGNSVIRLLVNAHREFGTNAGTQTVRESREKSKLKYTNLGDFTIKVSNYVKFYTEVDRHVMMAIEILGELEEAIGREGNNKQVQSAIQRILADHLPTFSNDPAGEAKALVPKLVSAVRAAASMVQTTSEFRSKPDASKLKANFSSTSGKSAACFEYFATGACKRGESCGFSHQQQVFQAQLKDEAGRQAYEKYKANRNGGKTGGRGSSGGRGKGKGRGSGKHGGSGGRGASSGGQPSESRAATAAAAITTGQRISLSAYNVRVRERETTPTQAPVDTGDTQERVNTPSPEPSDAGETAPLYIFDARENTVRPVHTGAEFSVFLRTIAHDSRQRRRERGLFTAAPAAGVPRVEVDAEDFGGAPAVGSHPAWWPQPTESEFPAQPLPPGHVANSELRQLNSAAVADFQHWRVAAFGQSQVDAEDAEEDSDRSTASEAEESDASDASVSEAEYSDICALPVLTRLVDTLKILQQRSAAATVEGERTAVATMVMATKSFLESALHVLPPQCVRDEIPQPPVPESSAAPSPSASQTRRVSLVKCDCGHVARLYVVGEDDPYHGRLFLRCPRAIGAQCDWFRWLERARPISLNFHVLRPVSSTTSGSTFSAASAPLESSCEIVRNGQMSLFAGPSEVGYVDVVPPDNMPGLTLHTLSEQDVGGDDAFRTALRDKAYAAAAAVKDVANPAKEKLLAAHIKECKKAAKALSVHFPATKHAVPNAAIARMTLAAHHAVKSVILPAILAHRASRASVPLGAREQEPARCVVDSGCSDTLFSRGTVESAGVSINPLVRCDISAANGASFVTDGVTTEPIPFHVVDVDGLTNVFPITGHQADLGDAGMGAAMNLIDVTKTLVMELGLTVMFRQNKDGNLGHCIVDTGTGSVVPMPLDRDRLPVFLQKGDTAVHPSHPDSIEELAAVFTDAAAARRTRISAKATVPRAVVRANVAAVQGGVPGSDSASPDDSSPSDEDGFESYLDTVWALSASKGAAKKRISAPRRRLPEYNGRRAHELLHRAPAGTRGALNSREVRFRTSDGDLKVGSDLTVQDLAYGPCNICKQVRTVAQTVRSGSNYFACRDCSGCGFAAH